MDFFEQVNKHVRELNTSERKIFEYVVRNIDEVKGMQIRTLAARCFVSTTTIMRFTRKLGFSGYREFSEALRLTRHAAQQAELPSVLWRQSYSEEYLKNIIESVRVLTPAKMERFKQALSPDARIYCFGTGLDQELARFAYHLFTSLGYRASCPLERFEAKAAVERFREGDVALLISMSGEDADTIELAERVQARHRSPVIATITQSANNTLQSLSSIDFYVFAERIVYDGADLSPRVSMMALVELLAYSLMKPDK
ncbi:MurR/RpiR family transcriptional regulator [Arabiibacter massiliensis]|uniref:MurR/RpiR family transcriptional regulator n=1 Tax=Arabiibacter massiliensis TaxID=1870985 RepID=UPI0009BB2626|nr:MurR/RpiR family transcriptional regulator [Arabiibacter massiliensis]